MEQWTAYINDGRLTTVKADTEESAREKIIKQLSRPGRSVILAEWREAGEVVKALKYGTTTASPSPKM